MTKEYLFWEILTLVKNIVHFNISKISIFNIFLRNINKLLKSIAVSWPV